MAVSVCERLRTWSSDMACICDMMAVLLGRREDRSGRTEERVYVGERAQLQTGLL